MRIEVSGVADEGGETTRTWDLLDRYDPVTGTSSMARTTGYTCTAGVRMLAAGLWEETGVHPPEDVGRDAGCFGFIMEELEKRGAVFRTS
jgi:saccharopine dehydrogenase-like NADP-dependent oxidoreductase